MAKQRNIEAPALVNPLEDRLGYQLRRASALLMAELGRLLAPTGLRPTEVSVLLVIRANEGCQQGAIGELLGIKPTNMVPLTARLVKGGLVDRGRADGRSHALSLTAAGRAMATTVSRLVDQHEAAIQSRLDPPTRDHLIDSLTRLRR